jgi:hypothetical protein
MMDSPRVFPCQVDPRLEHFQNEEVVSGYHPLIHHFAFKIRIALVDQRRFNARGSSLRQPEDLELVDLSSGCVPQPTTFSASSTVGMLITHSFVFLRMSNV